MFVEEITQPVVEEITVEPVVEPDPEPVVTTPEVPGDYDENLGFEERYFSHRQPLVADDEDPGDANFGTAFPENPKKGDVFLRVDFLPSRLYKWNNNKWIEVDKATNDRLAYNTAYIEHLIEKCQRKGLEIYWSDDEEMTPETRWNIKITDLFSKINENNYYSDPEIGRAHV